MDALSDELVLVPARIKYHGPKSLLELDVENIDIVSNGPGGISVEIHLKRKYFYHLATTYFPTLCLLFIIELLLFIPEEHFEAIIMVSLTIMLVMYTLYQSILGTLPQTSYLKMIDIWLMSCTTIPFLVFVIEVFSKISKYSKETVLYPSGTRRSESKYSIAFSSARKVMPGIENPEEDLNESKNLEDMMKREKEACNTEDLRSYRKIINAIFFVRKKRIICPLLTILLIITYMVIALQNYL